MDAAAAAPFAPEETLMFVDEVNGRNSLETNDGPEKDMVRLDSGFGRFVSGGSGVDLAVLRIAGEMGLQLLCC